MVPVVILILSQLAQSLRWPLLIACLVAAIAFLGKAGESRLFAAVACVVTGLGALWGFSLQSEEDNRPPAEILYARELLVDLAEGNSEPCCSMPEEEQRRLAERYQVDDCAAAEEAIEASIDPGELERLKEVTGTVLENRQLQGEGDGERTTLHSVRLDENPLRWKEIDFTYAHPKGFLKAIR